MARATRIMIRMGFISPPPCVTDGESREEEAAAAGLRTMQSAPHWETGVPFNEPASHSSSPSRSPLPQEGADDTDSEDDEKEDDSADEETEDATDSLLSELGAEELSEELELVTDAREKNRMEESCEDADDMLKLQSGRMNGVPDREEADETSAAEYADAAVPLSAKEGEATAAAGETDGRKGER